MADITAAGRSLYEAWEKRDFEAFEDFLADGVSFNDTSRGQVVKGKAAVKDWYASWTTACPDSVAGATVVAASDDTAVFEGVYAGTNTGAFGPFLATGRSVSLPWINVAPLRLRRADHRWRRLLRPAYGHDPTWAHGAARRGVDRRRLRKSADLSHQRPSPNADRWIQA